MVESEMMVSMSDDALVVEQMLLVLGPDRPSRLAMTVGLPMTTLFAANLILIQPLLAVVVVPAAAFAVWYLIRLGLRTRIELSIDHIVVTLALRSFVATWSGVSMVGEAPFLTLAGVGGRRFKVALYGPECWGISGTKMARRRQEMLSIVRRSIHAARPAVDTEFVIRWAWPRKRLVVATFVVAAVAELVVLALR